MTNTALDVRYEEVTDAEQVARAWRAVQEFKHLIPSFEGIARAMTRNSKIRIMPGKATFTDGQTVYIKPPNELGAAVRHVRRDCDKREDSILICKACRVREEVMTMLYHELSHIIYGSFEEASERDKTELMKKVIAERGDKFSAKIKERIETIAVTVRADYQQLCAYISPFMFPLMNALEDARVNTSMVAVRPGIGVMHESAARSILKEGTWSFKDERMILWSEQPDNSQAIIATYLLAQGYSLEGLKPEIIDALGDDEELNALCYDAAHSPNVSAVYELAYKVLLRLRELGYLKSDTDPQHEEEPDEDTQTETDGDDSDDDRDDVPDCPDPNPPDSADSEEQGETEAPGLGGQGGGEEPGESSPDPDPDEAEGDTDSDPDPDRDLDDSDGSGDGEPDLDEPGSGDSADDLEASGSGVELDDLAEDGGSLAEPDESAESDESDEPADPSTYNPLGGLDSPEGDADPNADPNEGGERGDDADSSSAGGGLGDDPERDESLEDGDGSEGDHESSDGDGRAASDDPSDDAREGDRSEPSLPDDRRSADLSELEGLGQPDPFDTPDEGEGSGHGDGERSSESGGVGEGTSPGPVTGTPDEAMDAIEEFTGHAAHDEEADEKLSEYMENAVEQAATFDRPAHGIKGLNVYTDQTDRYAHNWNVDINLYVRTGYGSERYRFGSVFTRHTLDGVAVPESMIGSALLKTRAVFDENKRARFQRNLKKGRIDPRSLGKKVPRNDQHLFRKKTLPGKRSYFVVIGMDLSGSTNLHDRLLRIKRAAMAQAELCARVGVDFVLYGHTGSNGAGFPSADYIDLYQVKGPGQAWDDAAKRRLVDLMPGGGNLDGHTMEQYVKMAMASDATDKIIMYYTDGEMPQTNFAEEKDILVDYIAKCKQQGIHLMGVGIDTDSPKKHGLDTVIVESDEHLIRVVEHLDRALISTAG